LGGERSWESADFIGYRSKVDEINGYDTLKYENPSDAVVFVQVNRTNLKEVYGSAPDCVADASRSSSIILAISKLD
jgi:hypothetical protein